MFNPNGTPKSVFSTAYRGHVIRVLQVETHQERQVARGKMLVVVQIRDLDPVQIDNEVTVLRALDSLIEDINDQREITAEIFDAENIKADDDRFIMRLDGNEYMACIEYYGELPSEPDDNEVPGYQEWATSRGVHQFNLL